MDLSAIFVDGLNAMVMRLTAWLPWILLLMALVGLLRLPAMLMARRRRRLIQRLEEARNSRVIAMIHRGDGLLSFLRGGGSIGVFESETILKIIRETPPGKPIDLVLHTPGGLILATAQIARALKNHPAAVRAIVPHWAMSGGTFLSLAADEIIMDKNAVLGPVDPQTVSFKGAVAMASVLRVIREKSKDEIDDETWIMADQAEKAIHQLEEHIYELLHERLGPEKARDLARTMTEGRWTHSFPITCEALRDMGLKVSTDVPKEAYQLLEAFPTGAKFRPVQWLPGKKRTNEESV
ncbi:MAG: SDH family Clp fold serine proteinase [Bacillota bacterium]